MKAQSLLCLTAIAAVTLSGGFGPVTQGGAAGAALPPFSQMPLPGASGSAYHDPQGRFVVEVPAGWTAGEAEGGARLVLGDAYVNVMVMEGVQGGWELGEQVLRQIRQQWRNFQEIDRGDRRLGALPASFGIYRGVNPKGNLAFMKVFVAPGSGRTFLMLLSWPVEEMASMAADINQIEQNFSAEGPGRVAGVPDSMPGPQPGPGPMPGQGPQPGSPQAGPQPSPNRAILGVMCRDITPQDMATIAAATSQGALVLQVGPNTPAAQAGLQPGDVIGAIDRQPVLRIADLVRIVGNYSPGAVVEILVTRQGKPQAFRVRLAGQGQTETARPILPGAPPPSGSRAGGDIQPPLILPPVPPPRARPVIPSSNLKPFRGSEFSVSIPDSWISTPSRSKGMYLFGAAQDIERMTNKDQILLGMNAGWDWINAPNVKTGADKHLDTALKQNPNVKILARQPTVVARLSAESILIENPSSALDEPELAWIVIVRPAKGLFFVQLVSPKSDFDALRPLFGRIVESIQFTKDSSSSLWEGMERR
jgi:membrane-associated protease RseP (regulator of RpoE activity)